MGYFRHLFITVLVLLALFFTLTGCISAPEKSTPPTKNTIPASQSPQAPSSSSLALELSNTIADIVAQLKSAVIFISAKVETESFFGKATQTKSGSGVIIDPQGYALTNNHVVEGAEKLEVTLPGSEENLSAQIVGRDSLTDLAVIKIEGTDDFPHASFGDASSLCPGNLVIAIGNPLALKGGSTITLGVVSNTKRSFTFGSTTFYDVIQTDAAINPGNSGGPLINLRGEIVGINTFIARGAQNIGFAVSANTAQTVYKELVSPPYHRVIRPWLGVILADIDPQLAAEKGLFKKTGILIFNLKESSPADKAGLKEGDVITEFEGEKITNVTQFLKLLWCQHEPGEEVDINFWRGKEKMTATVKLGERPS